MDKPRILVPMTDGCEEIEVIIPVDVWRRAGFEVITAGLSSQPVQAARQTRHLPDEMLEGVLGEVYDLIYLPGGRPGADHLAGHTGLIERLQRQQQDGKWIAAICAAPLVLDRAGLLSGKKFACHPGARAELTTACAVDERIVVDGKLITGIAAGAAMELALRVVQELAGPERVKEVDAGLLYLG
jgi:4-methyl-5(b-hydroxyethyl)-thiazole monophosphate biosynthesis